MVLPLSPVGIAQVAVLMVPAVGEKARLSTFPAQLLPIPVIENVVVWNDSEAELKVWRAEIVAVLPHTLTDAEPAPRFTEWLAPLTVI
jgi:hypothetical protein